MYDEGEMARERRIDVREHNSGDGLESQDEKNLNQIASPYPITYYQPERQMKPRTEPPEEKHASETT
jgi:phage-related protein